MAKLRKIHYVAIKHVPCYLKGTIHYGMLMSYGVVDSDMEGIIVT